MMRRTTSRFVGVSAAAVFAPPARVDLQQWCEWTNSKWDKVSEVVGRSFRVPAHNENAYTMAATATLRMIQQYDIDPQRVGFLGLGTESSTDNAAGSVIVRGMVDKGLKAVGKPPLSRNCEVPEFKHACLGGIYALKSAARYATTDGSDRLAIVVSSDIAEYQRGSSGEQTQGAGAVAMLVERHPKLFEIDLMKSGSASSYRGPDFRKPFKRHFLEGYHSAETQPSPASSKIADFPVFSGPYSTVAYQDEVTQAVEAMLTKLHTKPSDYYRQVSALFFHRPYSMMPIQAMSALYARGLARGTSAEHQAEFQELCKKAKVAPADVLKELDLSPDFFEFIERGEIPNVHKATNALAKIVRGDPRFVTLLEQKMSLGSKMMMHFGNLYSAALPCWLTAGFEEAYNRKLDIAGKPMVMIGYGSGDAAEAIPIVPVGGWEAAAAKLGVQAVLDEGVVTLTKEQYEVLHAGKGEPVDLAASLRKNQFIVDRIGMRNEPAFQDIGIEYYKYV